MFDADAALTAANAGVLRNVGYTLDEMHTMTPLDRRTLDGSFEALMAPLRRASGADQLRDDPPAKGRLDVSGRGARPVAYHRGAPVFAAVIQDISERVAIEAERAWLCPRSSRIMMLRHDGTIALVNSSPAGCTAIRPTRSSGSPGAS